MRSYNYVLVTMFSATLSLIILGMVFFCSVPDNQIKIKLNLDEKIFTFVPQGWGFFTRNPQEAQIVLYKKNDFDNFELVNHRHSNVENLCGLDRKTTKIFGELQLIKISLNNNQFFNTYWNYQAGIYSEIPSECYTVQNKMKDPILNGEYLIIFQKPIPWSWSKSLNIEKMPAKMIRVNII